jgi:nitrogen fixation NifU-like protein
MVRLELAVDDAGIVRDAYFTGEGCCVSQAAASMLVEKTVGKSISDLRAMSATDMLELFGPRLTPNRQKCCLLSWRVLQQALFSPVKSGT